MDNLRDAEIHDLYELVEAVETRLAEREAAGREIPVRHPLVYAAVFFAVLESARGTGHHGYGMLTMSPLLDAILQGVEGADAESVVLAALQTDWTAFS